LVLIFGVCVGAVSVALTPPPRTCRRQRERDELHGSSLGLRVPLYLTEAEVSSLLTPADAVAAVEDSFRRLAAARW
jgi:hypothetical protein